MRLGTLWRIAVLASLALLVSGQLCMLTTCVPRLTRLHASAHECCRATPVSPASPAPASTGHMPCDQRLSVADAPALVAPTLVQAVNGASAGLAASLAPPRAVRLPVTAAPCGGPPLERFSPAPAGLRAPPIA